MTDADAERVPLLLRPSTPDGERRRWGIGCLIVLLFLQATSTNGLDSLWRGDNLYAFRFDIDQFGPFLILMAVLTYILPMVIGIYADTVVGKYQTLFMGLILKATGSLIGFSVVLKLEAAGKDPGFNATTKVLAAVYAVSFTLIGVGALSVILLIITFGSEQVKRNSVAQASMIRWGLAILVLGSIAQYFITHYDNIFPPYHSDLLQRYPQTTRHAVILGADSVSLAVFLLGKLNYNKPTPAEGRTSFREVLQLVVGKIGCCKTWRPLSSSESIQQHNPEDLIKRRKIERLRIRKGMFTIPIMSTVSVSILILCAVDQVTLRNLQYFDGGFLYWFKQVRGVRFLLFLPLAALMECITRACKRHLSPDSLLHALGLMGFGVLFTCLALITAGIVAAALPEHNMGVMSYLPTLPHYILSGFAFFLILNGVILFCLTQCPPGLSTFITSITACLCSVFLPIEALLGTLVDFDSLMPYCHIVCFVMAAVALTSLLIIFLPSSLWYVRADREIARHEADGDDDETGQENND